MCFEAGSWHGHMVAPRLWSTSSRGISAPVGLLETYIAFSCRGCNPTKCFPVMKCPGPSV